MLLCSYLRLGALSRAEIFIINYPHCSLCRHKVSSRNSETNFSVTTEETTGVSYSNRLKTAYLNGNRLWGQTLLELLSTL